MTRVSDQIFYFVLFDGDMSQKPMISLILSSANGGLREKYRSTAQTRHINRTTLFEKVIHINVIVFRQEMVKQQQHVVNDRP